MIVVDYGHGLLSHEAIGILSSGSKFLAVNAQANAGNLGYHTISMYPRADYVTMTEGEIRLEARSRRGDLKSMVKRVADQLSCKRLAGPTVVSATIRRANLSPSPLSRAG